MQFYKFEGISTAERRPGENDSRRIMCEKARRISTKTNTFNLLRLSEAYSFVNDASGDMVTIGIIVKKCSNLNNLISEYLRAIGTELMETCLEEVTFSTLRNMLGYACRNDYIRDDDEVLEQFDLDKLERGYGRGVAYEEKILNDCNKKTVYEEAGRFLAKDTLIPELNRIYAGRGKQNVIGHPVHYMIETDDHETRKGICRVLLQALYAKKRLHSKRYCFLNFRPGESFSSVVYNCLYNSAIGGAIIVRYMANDDTEDDYASSGRDTIEALCEVMKKYRNQVLTVFCLPRECTSSKDIFYENLGNTSIIELKEDFVSGERAKEFLEALAKDSEIDTDQMLFEKLEDEKGYLAPDLHNIFDDWYNNKLKTAVYPQYKDVVTVNREVIKAAPKGSAYDELNQMIGLDDAKKVINQALNYCKAQKLFADRGMKRDHPTMHMIFTGNPGTAKTTVARLFAKIMKENNLLSKGNLIEVGRGDLVGKYVGWTAPMIQKKFKEAQGSVLFIDEAYSLVDDRNGSFGDEAISTIVQEMENHRDNVVVIFAGYPDKMECFLQKNPGLRSRIAYHVPFSDYDTESLCEIAKLIAKQKGLVITEEAYKKLSVMFDAARTENDFGNGRYVRNAIEKARMAQATRLLTMDLDSIESKDIFTITADDIELPKVSTKSKTKQIGFCS